MKQSIDERMAVLETLFKRNEKDRDDLFGLVRDHMEQETLDRKELIFIIGKVDKKVDIMKAYFLGGMGVLSIVWAVTKLYVNN